MSALHKFFEVSDLSKVNPLISTMASLDPERPDWLRATCRYADLPRVCRHIDRPYTVDISRMSRGAIAERIRWVIEMLDDDWMLDPSGLSFADIGDATLHRLRWGDIVVRS